jgi:NADH dehydrogenase/NADH:ubiquinone oxidoreductase subunit G
MPTLRVDGVKVQVPDGATVLAAARAAGAPVPTLCHHEGLEAWGGCRLCLVEIVKEGWTGPPRVVTSCNYPAEEGLIVRTTGERVVATRRVVVDLLLARCPDTPLVQRLAREHGIEATSYGVNAEPTDCVLCGLCTRACDRLGVSAIASVSRGVGRTIAPPFDQPPPDCIGCLACAGICPTGHIEWEETGERRTIWGRAFELQRCEGCGRPHVTVEQAAWARRHGAADQDLRLCDACKREQLARTLRAISRGEPVTADAV